MRKCLFVLCFIFTLFGCVSKAEADVNFSAYGFTGDAAIDIATIQLKMLEILIAYCDDEYTHGETIKIDAFSYKIFDTGFVIYNAPTHTVVRVSIDLKFKNVDEAKFFYNYIVTGLKINGRRLGGAVVFPETQVYHPRDTTGDSFTLAVAGGKSETPILTLSFTSLLGE